MSAVWPYDNRERVADNEALPLRPFSCLLLMPFEKRFDQLAKLIYDRVDIVLRESGLWQSPMLPVIERLDWVVSSEIIQQEIWSKIAVADMVFCDITGYNPNVMFEAGVCAAWKPSVKVVFIKDRFFKQEPAFDIAPKRYTEYELTSDGIPRFQEKVAKLTQQALIRYPDCEGDVVRIGLPLELDFANGTDDPRLYTPPLAHRRVVGGALEFGSTASFGHSWASLGKRRFRNFSLNFSARFVNLQREDGFIGVGLRSQHFLANYSHLLCLHGNGGIRITQPNEKPPHFYTHRGIRKSAKIDPNEYHEFSVSFDSSELRVRVDDVKRTFKVAKMPKVLGPGLIRLQSSLAWMAVSRLKLTSS